MNTFFIGTVIAVLLIGPILALTYEKQEKPKKRRTKRSPE